MPAWKERRSALRHLAKNLIPSLPELAAGICALLKRFSGRSETLTVRSRMPFFSWSLVPDMLSPSFCPWQCTHKAAPRYSPRVFVPTDERSRFRNERRIGRRAPPASRRVNEIVRARVPNGISWAWTPHGPSSLYDRGVILLFILTFSSPTVDDDTLG